MKISLTTFFLMSVLSMTAQARGIRGNGDAGPQLPSLACSLEHQSPAQQNPSVVTTEVIEVNEAKSELSGELKGFRYWLRVKPNFFQGQIVNYSLYATLLQAGSTAEAQREIEVSFPPFFLELMESTTGKLRLRCDRLP